MARAAHSDPGLGRDPARARPWARNHPSVRRRNGTPPDELARVVGDLGELAVEDGNQLVQLVGRVYARYVELRGVEVDPWCRRALDAMEELRRRRGPWTAEELRHSLAPPPPPTRSGDRAGAPPARGDPTCGNHKRNAVGGTRAPHPPLGGSRLTAVDMTQGSPLCQRSGGDLDAHMPDLAAELEAAKLPDRAAELRRLADAIEAEMPTFEVARSQTIRAIEAGSPDRHPRSGAKGSRVRLHRVGAGGLPCWSPRAASRGEARTAESLVWHRPDCEVEP